MPKPKGSSKTGGRSKGTPNKKSQLLSDAFAAQGIDVADELVKIYMNCLFDNDRLPILLKVLDYCYPRKKSLAHEDESSDRVFKITFIENSEPDKT